MKTKCIYLLILFISIVSVACEKTVDNIRYPEYKPMLVLHSFISPSDTLLRVHVSATKNIYGQRVDYPKQLTVTVTLIDNEQSFTFSSIDTLGYCYLKHAVEAGKSYKITAKCAGYPEAYGECSIPDQKDLGITMDTLSIPASSDWGAYRNYYVHVKLKDIPNETNYYNISCIMTSYYTRNSMVTKDIFPLRVSGSIYDADKEMIPISDHLRDGQFIYIPFSYYSYNDEYLTSSEFEASILMTDADYYQYHRSIQTYKGSDEPFTEFSPVYTNIKGGLGIFCSYVKYQQTFKIKQRVIK